MRKCVNNFLLRSFSKIFLILALSQLIIVLLTNISTSLIAFTYFLLFALFSLLFYLPTSLLMLLKKIVSLFKKFINFKLFCLRFVFLLDMVLLILVISFFINDLFSIIFSILDKIYNYISINDVVTFMNNNGLNATSNSSSTHTQIIHDDGSWSNAIRSLIIYSSGGYRLWLQRGGGTPGSRFVIVGSTLAADSLSRVVTNAINDPNYINNHLRSWGFSANTEGTANVTVNPGGTVDQAVNMLAPGQAQALAQTQAHSLTQAQAEAQAAFVASQNTNQNIGAGKNITNNFISGENGIEELSNKIVNSIMENIKPFVEPIQVSYSNEVLAQQIYGISIMLFILSILVIILLIFFILNTLVFIYSDKLIDYFNNKYIKWYIYINKKFIAVELFFLSTSILYFMYILSYGIHFIATHPITFS